MSILFFAEDDGTKKEESINNYSDIFSSYKLNAPNLSESLKQIFESAGANDTKCEVLIKDIESKCKKVVDDNNKEIKEKYPNISNDEALTISSYTCESIEEDFSQNS